MPRNSARSEGTNNKAGDIAVTEVSTAWAE
jgi:hypothetical protein